MRITIIQDDGLVGVDGVFRAVDLAGIDPAIHAIQFDTEVGSGHVEYDREFTVPVEVRDHAAEDAAWAAARAAKTPESEINIPVMKKTVQAHRPNEALTDFAPYQAFVDRWTAAAPPPPTPEQLKELEVAAVNARRDEALANGSVAWGGREWYIDEKFQLHLTGFVTAFQAGMLPPAATVAVRAANNTTHQLGLADLKALGGAVMTRVQQIWAQSWAEKDALG